MKATKAQIKELQALKLKKYRQKYNKFVVEGEKMTLEIIRDQPSLIKGIFALPEWLHAQAKNLGPATSSVFLLNEQELKKVSSLSTPNQVLVIAEQPDDPFDPSILQRQLVLYLDQIQDPGNLGTILRIADWFGIEWVLLSPACVDPYNPKVIQASMGAIYRVKTREFSFEALRTSAGGAPFYATQMEGEDVFSTQLSHNGVIIIGNESSGISAEILRADVRSIAIPSYAGGRAESLNAAVATGIIVAAFRQYSNRT